jgi:tRNA (adenine57-N1/adenine58-N1)-methyltransferase
VGAFAAGDRVLLVDARSRRYLVTLRSGGEFHTHLGAVAHDALIGRSEGTRIRTSGGSELLAFRPTLADYVLKMRRGAQVVYPKDSALIVVYADIFPGARVLEAGTGSGALTLALARAVGPDGLVISYEARADHHARAAANIAEWYEAHGREASLRSGRARPATSLASGQARPAASLASGQARPAPENIELRAGDVLDGVPDRAIDRMVLDMPEPWLAVGTVTSCLRDGGVLCCYLPTVPQVAQTVETMRTGGFTLLATFESLLRTWNVEGPSVRPDHRMVAHTGFIVTGRKLAGE